eukprot:4108242-Pyramimonas_sp.AAC.2
MCTREINCWAAHEAGARLVPFSYSAPLEPAPKEVAIQITHCGVCHSDVHQIDDDWKAATFPLVPGTRRALSNACIKTNDKATST